MHYPELLAMRKGGTLFITLFALLVVAMPVYAAGDNEAEDGSKVGSGLPIPRFASLRSNDVNMRTGPGTRYPIEWVYAHQGLPVEITAEYEIWRRVRDPDGAEGWVHKSALSGKRSVIVTGSLHELYHDADITSPVIAHLEPGSTGQLGSCAALWCKVKFTGENGSVKGYLRKTDFWGAYPGEVFD
jgi:SH3-like domain-containing protein